jgi:thymidylate synthase (FAD)
MKIFIVAHTPDPEKVIAIAARLCYTNLSTDQLVENLTPIVVQEFLKKLTAVGHESPLEHISFTFMVEGISRALSHQLVRHRAASYSQRSQRYCGEGDFEFVTPPSIQNNFQALARFSEAMKYLQTIYDGLSSMGIPNEDARFVLPNACETRIVFTMNARALLNFFQQRLCQRAQWEIRAMADEMRRQVREIAPNIFASSGPTCETENICWEGTMTCGRAERVMTRVPASAGEHATNTSGPTVK